MAGKTNASLLPTLLVNWPQWSPAVMAGKTAPPAARRRGLTPAAMEPGRDGREDGP